MDLRPGEGLPSVLLFLGFFLLIAFQYATKSVRQSTYVQSLGAAMLPLAYLLVALCSYPLLRLYSRFADRMARHRLIAATSALIALSMILFWWLFQFAWPWVPVVFYIWVSIVYVMMVSQFWSFSNLVLDPRQAKRLFGFIGAGGLLGGVAGGQVARFATELVGTRYALVVGAAMLLLFVVLLLAVQRIRPPGEESAADAAGLGKLAEAKGGLEALKGSRHLRLVAALMLLTVMVAQVVDLQFNWAVEQSTGTLDEATSFFGNFYSVMGISAFVFQLLFTARIHRLLGVGFAMRVLPLTMGLGTGALFLASLFPGALVVAAALVLKIGENGIRYSLDQATRELLYMPVPGRVRVKAKAFIDVFVQRGAKGLAAILLLPVTFGVLSVLQAGWISLVLIVIWLGVTVALQREYVVSFRKSLRRRRVDDAAVPINLSDVTTLELLVQSLGSADTRQVLHALELLDSNDRGRLVPPLLLYHDDPGVRRRTLDVLARNGRRDALHLVERRLADDDPEVRAGAVVALATLHGEEAAHLMVPRLRDPDPGVRAAAIACLADHGGAEALEAASEHLVEMLSDGDPSVRAEAAKALGSIADPLFQEHLIRLLYDPDSTVVREAIASMGRRTGRDGFNPLYLPGLVTLLQRRRLKHDAREAIVGLGESAVPALVHFMNDPDEPIWVRRAIPKALAAIGTEAAVEGIVSALATARDGFLRRKSVEALAALPEEMRSRAADAVGKEIHREAGRYFAAFRSLAVLAPGIQEKLQGPLAGWEEEDAPDLLESLLAERMEDSVQLIFRLLAIRHPPEHVRSAHHTLVDGPVALRGHALEFLDNTLEGEVRRDVFLVVGDEPLATRWRAAEGLFGPPPGSRRDVVERYLTARAEGDRAGLCAAALYTVHRDRIDELYPRAEALVDESESAFVREAAEWVLRRRSERRSATLDGVSGGSIP